MNALTDVNLTEIMEREGIAAIKRWPAGRFSVELDNGNFGVGRSVGNALAKAKTGADSLRRAA